MGRHTEHDNSFAHNKEKQRIHISEAISGRKGYYCIGCEQEMQAVKSRLQNRISYFRHHALDVIRKAKCTYSDVAERFKVAGEVLTQLKQLRVPSVYKYPPAGEDGPPFRVCGPKTIQAFAVMRNCYFYHDPEHGLLMGEKRDMPELTFLAKGDVVFLDQKEEPILIVQFVQQHKMSADVKIKLNTLGIDTIQVTVPRESPEAIAAMFQTTEKIKWLYNNEHASTAYVRIPVTDSEGLRPLDELQRQFFEENFFCRRAQIARVIRTIKRCLESKPYRNAEDGIRSAIGDVEQDKRNVEEQIRDLETTVTREVEEEFEPEQRSGNERRERIRYKSEKIRRLARKVKDRYDEQSEELEREERDLESRIDQECRAKGVRGSSIASRKRELEDEIQRVEHSIATEKRNISELEKEREALPEKFGKEEEEVEHATRELSARIAGGNIAGDSELPGRIAATLDFRGTLNDYIENYPTFVRYNKAWRSFNSGAYKNWPNENGVLSKDGAS